MRPGRRAIAALVVLGGLASASAAHAAPLRAGVGRADITPPTGYYFQGWVRSDGISSGQHTRLFARAIVLEQDGHKLALVAEDLNGIAGGALQAAAAQLANRGFSEQNILDSASHTHSAPTGYFNFSSYNTVFMTIQSPTSFNLTGALDPQLYAFEVRQLALAIARADDNLGPARAAWGSARLPDLTQNRSLEAHLANYGIDEPNFSGNAMQDPWGPAHTIDPDVQVLRVDKLVAGGAAGASPPAARRPHRHRGRRVLRRHQRPHRARSGPRYAPVAMWTQFANHGTVNKYNFAYYNADHHGAAIRITEAAMRAAGGVPAGQDVVNAYGNSDEGDVTAGLEHTGPAAAEYVGRREADAFLSAWRDAGQHLASRLDPFQERWTRVCFCGQPAGGGRIDTAAAFGVPQLTGSEEGRGPLYDVTHVPLEAARNPIADPAQGDKVIYARPPALDVPTAVPLAAVRLGDRMIVTVPGEMTVGLGERLRSGVLAATAGTGVSHVVIAGLVNEYLSYFTTPEEYTFQDYEGGSTLYGRTSGTFVNDSLVDLATRLAQGAPAPAPYAFDPAHGVAAGAPPFSAGASAATPVSQPQRTPRLAHALFAWSGGPKGTDRPLDRAFVTISRQTAGGWRAVTDDLGLQILWDVDASSRYTARWEVPLDAAPGSYRFEIHANRYALASQPFEVVPSDQLTVAGHRDAAGAASITLDYPAAVYDQDYTFRPEHADGGELTAIVGAVPHPVSQPSGASFALPGPAGAPVSVAPGAAHDRYGNTNGAAASF